MTHISVLVVGDDVDRQLQPYHDFRYTGTNDEFVVPVDRFSEERERYATSTMTRLRTPDGLLFEPWASQFYREMSSDEILQFCRTARGKSGATRCRETVTFRPTRIGVRVSRWYNCRQCKFRQPDLIPRKRAAA